MREQPENAEVPAIIGLLISMSSGYYLVHPENTSLPIKVTEIGIAIEVKLKQLEEAEALIDVTASLIVTDRRRCE